MPAVAVAVIKDGKLEWAEVFGERAPGVPATRDTVFNVASLTKPLFAMMTLQLAAAGNLDLDADLTEFWVDPDVAGDSRHRALTPRLVLGQRTGFQNWRGKGKLAFAFEPGTQHEYSGEGFEYLRRAIEKKTGDSLPHLMELNVLKKAGMKDTAFGWDDRLAGRMAVGYNQAGQPRDQAEIKQRTPNAAASTFTTIDDYTHFVEWILAGADLPSALFQAMQQPQLTPAQSAEKYGLCWMLVNLGDETVLSHSGRENGVRTQVYILPKRREALVVFTNGDNGELVIQAITEQAFGWGSSVLEAEALDAWKHLTRMPTSQLKAALNAIVRSPSFTAKFLQSVQLALVEPSGLSPEEKQAAKATIKPITSALLAGKIDRAAFEPFIGRFLDMQPDRFAVRTSLSDESLRAYLADAKKLSGE